VLCLEPKDRHVAEVVGSPDLDQRLPTLEAGGSNLGREDFANRPGDELRGYRGDIGLDGLPTDPNRLFNRAR
jgi:hypothetical protein